MRTLIAASGQRFSGRVHLQTGMLTVASRAMTLFVAEGPNSEWRKLATLPLRSLKSVAARNPLTARLLRGSVDHVILHRGSLVALACGRVFQCDLETGTVRLVSRISGSRPLSVVKTCEGRLYY